MAAIFDPVARGRKLLAMSFAPIGDNPDLELAGMRGREHELEMKAELHSQVHGEDDRGDARPGGIRGVLGRAWAAIRRRG
jgi:hypothetical protein